MSLPPEQVSPCASFNEQKPEKNVWQPRLGHKRHIASACISLLWCSPLEKTTVLWGCPQAHAGDHLDRIWGLPPLSPSWAPRDRQQQGAGHVSESSGKRVPQPSVNCPDWCSMEHDGAIPPKPCPEVKASASNVGDPDSIPGLGRSPGEANGNPLQYSCLENPMDGGAW